ncbi:hypothetical protein K2P47_00300 [Patescibacteria group bacterium]|nr:hypothetical protein [Patescibacteria group bacterium]
MKKRLSQSTIEKLNYYVYALIDPRSDKVFYVGKGKGNRIYAHVEASESVDTNEVMKIAKIREIRAAKKDVKHVVIRHGLTEDQAFAVEAAVIDYVESVQKQQLTNLMSGHYTAEAGIRTIEDIEIQYEAKPAIFSEPIMLIRVNRHYKHGITDKELYNVTRQHWRVGPRAFQIKYACAVYLGIIREVYEIKSWTPTEVINGHQRHGFNGRIASKEVRDKYRYTSVKHLFKQGHQSSIVYAEPN